MGYITSHEKTCIPCACSVLSPQQFECVESIGDESFKMQEVIGLPVLPSSLT